MTDVAVSLYLDLLKRCVTNLIYRDPAIHYIGDDLDEGLIGPFSLSPRVEGKDWPSQAHTMIGTRRLDNIQALVEQILHAQVAGDLIETGVWRGGSTIFMRGVLQQVATHGGLRTAQFYGNLGIGQVRPVAQCDGRSLPRRQPA